MSNWTACRTRYAQEPGAKYYRRERKKQGKSAQRRNFIGQDDCRRRHGAAQQKPHRLRQLADGFGIQLSNRHNLIPGRRRTFATLIGCRAVAQWANGSSTIRNWQLRPLVQVASGNRGTDDYSVGSIGEVLAC